MVRLLKKKWIMAILAFVMVGAILSSAIMVLHVSITGKTAVYTLYYGDDEVARASSEGDLQDAIRMARLNLGQQSDEMFLSSAEFNVQQTEAFFLYPDKSHEIVDSVEQLLLSEQCTTLNRSYTVKINEYTTNLATAEEVIALLQGSVSQYDEEGIFSVVLELDKESELNVLTARVEKSADEQEAVFQTGGIDSYFEEIDNSLEQPVEQNFEDFDLGVKDIYFASTVEVVEAYLLESQLTSVEVAIEEVTKKLEKEEIYEIVSGDTLSGISMATNIPLDQLIELNPTLENENSLIRIGDELIITVPEPELTVIYTKESYYKEDYEAEIIYVDNDDWYTTTQVTLQQPSSGHHEVVVTETFRNDTELERVILKEEVVMEAVPKIVERGTIIPPTYIKPLSGGTTSSTFGYRSSPTAGASSYHKGHDWSTPTGTAIMASSAGVVSKAGWGSGYGYVIYIDHADGRQTRYAHLSKILVSVGQYVSQGEKIALSGNTGVSTGPHLHFELLINGVQVNPLNYLD
ncbi:MAG: M23 family metallopeptidase [Eubacteriales bacterium]